MNRKSRITATKRSFAINDKEIDVGEIDLLINQVIHAKMHNGKIDEKAIAQMANLDLKTFQKRSCWSRWFGPLSAGSMRGSIFSLMSTAVGAGILSLPYVFKSCGILTGTVFLVIGAILAYFTMVWLIKGAFHC